METLPKDAYDLSDSTQVCHFCLQPQYAPYLSSQYFSIPLTFQKCQCGIIKQTPLPNEKFFNWFFNSEVFFDSKRSEKNRIWGYYDYFKDEPSRMATSLYRFKKLSPYFGQRGEPKNILKIGPATGTFLKVAKDAGHTVRGVDLSSRFVDYAKSHYEVDIDHGAFEKMGYPDSKYDVVLLFNVIENLPRPLDLVREVRRVLKPGGLFILNFVDMEGNILASVQKERYFLFRPPICYAFTEKSLVNALGGCGFQLVGKKRDVRFMTLEKILTLLGWNKIANLAEKFGLHVTPFPFYAYPSQILICQKPNLPQTSYKASPALG